MKNFIFILLSFILLSSCVSKPVTSEYAKTIDKYSRGKIKYRGFDNTFQYRATIMNTTIQNAYIEEKGRIYKWDEAKKRHELAQLQRDNATTTSVWVSFYTPSPVDDNLHKSKTVWSIYLHTPTQRYEGKAQRDTTSNTETLVLFPYHSPYATAYIFEFPVPLSEVQANPSKMVITGPLGSKEITFPANL